MSSQSSNDVFGNTNIRNSNSNSNSKPWAEYALFGSWTEEDLYETYKFAFYDRSIDIKELISLYMTWKQYCIRKELT